MNVDTYRELQQQYLRGCVFCDPSPPLLLASVAEFKVSLDVAPLTPGHVIIYSADHHASGGELPAHLFGELEAVVAGARRIVEAEFGPTVMYEHGRAGHCMTDGPEHRLCHHFHLHCVPADVDLTDELGGRFQRIPDIRLSDLPGLYERFGDYLLFGNSAGTLDMYPVVNQIPRHLLRTMISSRLGLAHLADWRAERLPDDLVAGMQRLSGFEGQLSATSLPGLVSTKPRAGSHQR